MISVVMLAAGRELSEPRLSPDGDTVAFVTTRGGRASIALVGVHRSPERTLTTDPPPRPGRPTGGGSFDWLPDGSAIVYAAVDGNLWSQDEAGGPPTRLTDQSNDSPATMPAVSPDGTRVAYVIDQRHVAVVGLASDGPWPVRLTPPDAEFSFDPSWSGDSDFVAWHSWRPPAMSWDESTWQIAPADGSGTIIELPADGFAVQQPRFAPVATDLAYLADRTGWLNLHVFGAERDLDRPVVDEPFEHGEPAQGPGQRSFAWSPDGAAIAFTRNEGGFGRLCVVDLASGAVRDVSRAVHGGLDWKGGTLVAIRSGGTTPTQLVAYEVGGHGEGSWARTVLAVGPVIGFERHLVEPETVSWPSDDGVEIHGRLYRPHDRPGPSPLFVWVHGGPIGQWPVSFNARIAYWLSRGWSVLLPDYRGSSGWGRAYTQALRGRWGELDTADCASGARAAIDRRWTTSDSVVAMGGSAGGFTVLNMLANNPGLFAAAIALYPVTDLRALDLTTHRFEAHTNQRLVGPWPEAADAYRSRSPLNRAAEITTPLLVLHGTADPVVPIAQTEALVAAMARAGRPIEFHAYDGEGHGWRHPETTADELARIGAFLDRHVAVVSSAGPAPGRSRAHGSW